MSGRKIRGLFMAKVLLAATAVLHSCGLCGEEFRKSSLIVPQGVSYRFTPIRFTRDVRVVEGRLYTKKVTAKDSSGDDKSNTENRSASDSVTATDTTLDKNMGVEANAGASAKAGVSIWTGVQASAEVHGGVDAHVGMEKTSRQTDHSARSSGNKTETLSTRLDSYRNADSVEDSMQGKYGDWYLTFSMYLKNLDISDECHVQPPPGTQLSARVVGLSQPIDVPCEQQRSISIGIEEVVCRFTVSVHDQKLMRELKELEETHSMDKLSVQIDGNTFPIISKSGKNILTELKLVEMKNPTTEIRLGFGEAKVLSPWRVKQRFGRSSGRRGQFVTLRDALDAINEKIAEDDSMPERVFECNGESNLCAVSEIRLGTFDAKKGIVPCVKFDNDLADATLQILDKRLMDKPINQFKVIEFSNLDIDEMIKKYKQNPQKYDAVYHTVVDVLKNGDQKKWVVCEILSLVLLCSNTRDEREKGYKTLYSFWNKNNDIRALAMLFDEYRSLGNTKEFPYRNKISEWIPEFVKNGEWISTTRPHAVEILDTLIKDGQTGAVIQLAKLPTFACSTNGCTALMLVAKSGNVDMAKALLKEVDFDVNGGNRNVGTALEWAAKEDKVEMCKYLVGVRADPNITFGDEDTYITAVDEAANNNAVNSLKYLIEQAGGELHNAHYRAARGGALEAMQYLIEKFPRLVNSRWNGKPLLSYAAESGNLSLCKYLVEKGALVVYDDKDVRASDLPISQAAIQKHFDVVDFLFEKGADFKSFAVTEWLLDNGCSDWLEEKISSKKIDAGIVLCVAIMRNNAEDVKRFARFVDVNKGIDEYKWLPLCWAAQVNKVDAARELIKAGAKVNYSLENKQTPIQQACRAGSLDMVKFLYVECGAILDDAIFVALRKKQKVVLDWFLDYEKDGVKQFPVSTYSHGKRGTLLMDAAAMEDSEMCDYLIEKGADIKYQPEGKCSVLEYVIRLDNLPILRYFVDQRGYVVKDEILEAARKGSMKCLKYLIEEKRMSKYYFSKENGCLLFNAIASDTSEKNQVFDYLMDQGVDVSYVPEGFCSVLEYVIRLDNLPILRYLVEQRRCVVKDEILEAARNGSMKCLKYLIEEKRMSPNYCSKNKNGFLLAQAAGNGKTDACRYLISRGANVNFKPVYNEGVVFDDYYKTALEMAQDNGHAETAKYLISVGASNE